MHVSVVAASCLLAVLTISCVDDTCLAGGALLGMANIHVLMSSCWPLSLLIVAMALSPCASQVALYSSVAYI
jgi:hypothetical protein